MNSHALHWQSLLGGLKRTLTRWRRGWSLTTTACCLAGTLHGEMEPTPCRARQYNSTAIMAPLTTRVVNGRVFLQAQASIALVTLQDLPACKAFVLQVDYPLLPFPATTPVDIQVLQPLQLPPTCSGELGANYQGEEIATAKLGAHLQAACDFWHCTYIECIAMRSES